MNLGGAIEEETGKANKTLTVEPVVIPEGTGGVLIAVGGGRCAFVPQDGEFLYGPYAL
jgi:hypothetical protein